MINGSNARVTSQTRYILLKLYSIAPDSFASILYIMFTNTTLHPNCDTKTIDFPIDDSHILSLNNHFYSRTDYSKLLSDDRKIVENAYYLFKMKFEKMID